ncbi:MAG: hypothetical protein P4K98_08730 [Bryobacteraceae bacterium]|nr:hypothetical protein [Bryobacteraceae bacterium]
MVIEIPFSFEFRTTEVCWNQSHARITGWARRTDATIDGNALVAVIAPDGVQYAVRYSRHRLPEGWRHEGLWLEAYTDEDVERVFAGFEPLLLVQSGRNYVTRAEFKEHSKPADCWQLREEFLRLTPNSDEAVAFLRRWGRWNLAEYVELPELIRLQEAVREALMGGPEKWFQSAYSFPPTWDRSPEYPFFTFLTDQCEVAIRLSVTIDLLKGVKFKPCARPDCGRPFAVGSHKDRKFCCRECGHLEAVRRSRKNPVGAGAE